MPLRLFRIDERLLHGQVIVGWGMRLRLDYYVVVDDDLAVGGWEQELYRAAVPAEAAAEFVSLEQARDLFSELDGREGRGALLTRDTSAMRTLAEMGLLKGRTINVGGLHAAEGRWRVLDYVYVDTEVEEDLRAIDRLAGKVTARDLPASQEVRLEDLLDASS